MRIIALIVMIIITNQIVHHGIDQYVCTVERNNERKENKTNPEDYDIFNDFHEEAHVTALPDIITKEDKG